MTDETEPVTIGLDEQTLLQLLRRASSQERTVLEFQVSETEDGPVLDTILDITDHVESLEENIEHE